MSPTQEEAMRMALEALKSVQDHRPNDETNNAITALRVALAGPVAFVNAANLQGLTLGLYGYAEIYAHDSVGRIPLYTSVPPIRTPLTKKEIWDLYYSLPNDPANTSVVPLARAIEAAHGIGKQE